MRLPRGLPALIPTSSVRGSPSPASFLVSLTLAARTGVGGGSELRFPDGCDVEPLSYLFVVCVFSVEECLLRSTAHF